MGDETPLWTVHDNGQQTGPHSTVEIAMLVGAGKMSTQALVWREGEPAWLPVLSIIPPPPTGSTPPPMPPQQQPPFAMPYSTPAPVYPQQGNRVAAGILGILLGGLGIHKFVLGYTTAGIIMLLVTVLTCGWGGIIMHTIGLIEGIIYLTKTDEQFYNEYVATKKDWF